MLKHLEQLLRADAPALIRINLPKQLWECSSRLSQSSVDLVVDALLFPDCFVRYNFWTRCGVLLFVHSDLVAAEDPQEALVVDTCVFVFPKIIHKLVQLLLIYSKVKTLEYVREVVATDEASSALVDEFEQTV